MSPNCRLPFYNPLDPTHPKIWPDYKLVMPVCAVGNIGQLACDLIISTLLNKHECHLVGRIYSPALMSVAGPNAFTMKGPPTTSTEVYESKKHKIVLVQQRTSYFKDLKNIYIGELTNWIKESKFDSVYILTSSFAQCNPDTSQLGCESASPVRTITTSLFEADKNWNNLNLKPLPDKRTIKVVQDGLTFLPGSGITKPLIKACEKSFIPAAFIIDFCSEGINILDCYEIVNIVDKLLNLGCGTDKVGSDSTSELDTDPQHMRKLGWVEPYSWGEVSNKFDDGATYLR